MHSVNYKLHTANCTLHTVHTTHFTLHTVHTTNFTLHTVHTTNYTVHTVHIAHCTLHTVHTAHSCPLDLQIGSGVLAPFPHNFMLQLQPKLYWTVKLQFILNCPGQV